MHGFSLGFLPFNFLKEQAGYPTSMSALAVINRFNKCLIIWFQQNKVPDFFSNN
jgi:hypothetical protein